MAITKKSGDARISKASKKVVRMLRLEELKLKIMDDDYLNNAVDRIATVLSKSIAESPSFSERAVNKLM